MSEQALFIEGSLVRAGLLRGPLSAVLHRAEGERLVIFAHGFTGTKSESGRLFVTAARALAAAGISALRFDFWGSGDSAGEFNQMTPNTEIADLKAIIRWASKRYSRIGLLGLSMGGGVAICAAAQMPEIQALVTWSTVPSFAGWRSTPDLTSPTPMAVGPRFFTDRPVVDVPEAFCSIAIPKLQVQGDQDLPGFREQFTGYFCDARPVKRHVVIAGADHTFNHRPHRNRAIALSMRWFEKHL